MKKAVLFFLLLAIYSCNSPVETENNIDKQKDSVVVTVSYYGNTVTDHTSNENDIYSHCVLDIWVDDSLVDGRSCEANSQISITVVIGATIKAMYNIDTYHWLNTPSNFDRNTQHKSYEILSKNDTLFEVVPLSQ